jgi:hypothetical protein
MNAGGASAASTLTLSHLRFHLVPGQPLHLPAFNKGNSLRGGFGGAFRKLVCVDMHWECADCSLRYTCPYTKVFNPFIPPDAPQFSGNQNIPRPFIFKPPLSEQTHYAAGEPLVFDLVLVGTAIDYLPYFVVAFRELGVTGFGVNRACVRLDRVESIDSDETPTTVYEASTNLVRPAPPLAFDVPSTEAFRPATSTPSGQVLFSQGAREPKQLTLEFLTPTTLKSGSTAGRAGETVRRPAFHHLIKRLRDRVNALSTFYGEGPLPMDFKAFGKAAERVETSADRTRWVERSRVARRRNVTHDLSGFVGALTVRGDLAPFLPLLQLGEYVHVGKNAVFGNGWFVIRDN